MAPFYWRSVSLICALFITTARSKTIGDRQVSETLDYLEQFGYYDKPPSITDADSNPIPPTIDAPSSTKAIRSFQKFFNLPQTGELDAATANLISQPRCGVPDVSDNGRPLNFEVFCSNCKFRNRDLTYFVRVYSNTISRSEFDREVGKAFKSWSDVTNLSFRQVNHKDADIRISFHGSANHFEPPSDEGFTGSVLAHAWAPTDGRLHFNEQKTWNTGSGNGRGVSLYAVALHEIGHNLGLRHSKERKSIMWPSIRSNINELDKDDITGVQSIYGKPVSPPSDEKVLCGGHYASSCSRCPQGHGAGWCNGDCKWNGRTCVDKGSSSCTCSDFIDGDGHGNCKKALDNNFLCYVNQPSNCGDLKTYNGKQYSFEACKGHGGDGKCKTNNEGPKVRVPCIFPFKFAGTTHHGCITDYNDPGDNRPWCSTKVDGNGVHVGKQSQWGFCGNSCPNTPENAVATFPLREDATIEETTTPLYRH